MSEIQIDLLLITKILNYLSINQESEPNHRGYLKITCPNPLHRDENPSAGIDINTGIVNCFSCGYKRHIFGILQDNLNISYKEVMNFLKKDLNAEFKIDNSFVRGLQTQHVKPQKKKIISKGYANLKVSTFNPSEYIYTHDRGFTHEFLNKFNIKVCTEGWYKDYMIIPITYNIFEARKLKEFEVLRSYYQFSKNEIQLLEILKKHFNDDNKKYNFKLNKEFKLIWNDPSLVLCQDKQEMIKYLIKPKTLYPKGAVINDGLFNYRSLDPTADWYISEGIGSLPKLWEGVSSNVTCTYGTAITHSQVELFNKTDNRKIFILDGDQASIEMVDNNFRKIKNMYVIDNKVDDTELNYIDSIKKLKPIRASKFIIDKSGLFS